MEHNDGGRASPWCGDLNEYPTINLGMTLRDYFAAKAMLLAFERYRSNITKDLGDEWHWKDSDWDEVAYSAYRLADAMIKARGEA